MLYYILMTLVEIKNKYVSVQGRTSAIGNLGYSLGPKAGYVFWKISKEGTPYSVNV